MEFVRTERNGNLLIAILGRGKANALNNSMIGELALTIADVDSDANVRGVVLASDRPRFFSSGFDVVEVFGYDRHAMRTFFEQFGGLCEAIQRLPKPVVAAVSGHAYAGGAILALASDERVFADGEFGFALNEINLGLALTPAIVRMAIHAVGIQTARDLILGGRTFTPARSRETGLAAEVVAVDAVLDRAIARARELADKAAGAFGMMKRVIAETSGLLPPPGYSHDNEPFLTQWFSPEAMALKQALMQSMAKK
jgi:enoyl-CoA hydratase/carnithine racemase